MHTSRLLVTTYIATKESVISLHETLEERVLRIVKQTLNCAYVDGILRPHLALEYFKANTSLLTEQCKELEDALNLYKNRCPENFASSILVERSEILINDLKSALYTNSSHVFDYYTSLGLDPNRIINTYLDNIYAIFSYHFNEYFDKFHDPDHIQDLTQSSLARYRG